MIRKETNVGDVPIKDRYGIAKKKPKRQPPKKRCDIGKKGKSARRLPGHSP